MSTSRPRISLCVPTHEMENGEYFLDRLQKSLDRQTFRDFEVVVSKEGRMAENTNKAIKQAKGEIIKVLFMDDYLWSNDALQHLSDNFKGGWYASGCVHTDDGEHFFSPHKPEWNPEVPTGKNTIGSPSVIAFENKEPLLFDENLSWLLDCELYGRLYARYGEPTIEPLPDIAIGIGLHQTTHTMTDDEKRAEHYYLQNKYGITN